MQPQIWIFPPPNFLVGTICSALNLSFGLLHVHWSFLVTKSSKADSSANIIFSQNVLSLSTYRLAKFNRSFLVRGLMKGFRSIFPSMVALTMKNSRYSFGWDLFSFHGRYLICDGDSTSTWLFFGQYHDFCLVSFRQLWGFFQVYSLAWCHLSLCTSSRYWQLCFYLIRDHLLFQCYSYLFHSF